MPTLLPGASTLVWSHHDPIQPTMPQLSRTPFHPASFRPILPLHYILLCPASCYLTLNSSCLRSPAYTYPSVLLHATPSRLQVGPCTREEGATLRDATPLQLPRPRPIQPGPRAPCRLPLPHCDARPPARPLREGDAAYAPRYYRGARAKD
jgi:hypothetical protein